MAENTIWKVHLTGSMFVCDIFELIFTAVYQKKKLMRGPNSNKQKPLMDDLMRGSLSRYNFQLH